MDARERGAYNTGRIIALYETGCNDAIGGSDPSLVKANDYPPRLGLASPAPVAEGFPYAVTRRFSLAFVAFGSSQDASGLARARRRGGEA